ncbi:unnamed protein product, partial [Didymodactylos carnosus]
RSIHDFIPSSSTLTKLTAAELSLVFHGVHHGHSYISQSCTIDLLKKIFNESNIGQNIACGKTKSRDLAVNVLVESGITRSVLEVLEQPRESAEHIVAALRGVLTKNNIDIQQMTSIGADNTNTNYGRHHSVFSIIKLEVLNLLKGNCYCHILNNSVKNSHPCLLVNIESYLSSLYSHFSSSSKRVAALKEYFEFVEEDYLLSYVYSIPCSNAFAEGVFSHMKHAWTPSRNSMSIETVAAELQIRLNCKMKCNDFFTFVQNEPDLIKCARRSEKYSYIKKALF